MEHVRYKVRLVFRGEGVCSEIAKGETEVALIEVVIVVDGFSKAANTFI